MLTVDPAARWRTARPFVALGAAAVIAGGMVAAGVAHRPVELMVWMSAYLVLIVGVAQVVFGAGQAWLTTRQPGRAWVAVEWIIFNLGNAGVIVGTLSGGFGLVLAGTALFAVGVALFLAGTRGGARSGWLTAYRVLLGLIFLSSLVGLGLSAARGLR